MRAASSVRTLSLCLAYAALTGACAAEYRGDSAAPRVRPAAVAGGFYPRSAARLGDELKGYLDGAPDTKPEGEIVAAVAPHAGYVYSGAIAAQTHRLLSDVDCDTMVIIGHDAHTPGVVAFLSSADAFATPLGEVRVDTDMVDKLVAQHPGIVKEDRAHAREHTVEVQLPFLQYYQNRCKIVPILFGHASQEHCRILADAIDAAAGDRKVFLLASTDLSHYPPYDEARKVDGKTLDILRTMDLGRLFAHLTDASLPREVPGLSTAMCARGGVGTALLFAKAHGANNAQILAYANSGDVSIGDRRRVVGYGAALLVRTTEPSVGR